MPTHTPVRPAQRPPHRLPAVTEVPSRGAEVAKGVAALIGSLVVAVGVPIALLAAFGMPWPDEQPTADWLTRPVTAETVLGVLAVVAWLAWAHFVVCLIVEAVAERRHRGLAPHVPGGGIGTQTLARRLVATIVLIAGTTSVGMSSASAAGARETASHTAGPSMSSVLSERLTEAAALHGDDHESLPSTDELESPDSTDVAQGVTTYYEVKPPHGRHYDTLWDIADRYLGDGLRYKEIWELNRDDTQPDGRTLKDANLIYPGWVMKMPSDAAGPGLKVVDHAADFLPTSQDGAAEASTTSAGADVADEAPGGAENSDSALVSAAWSPVFGVAGGLALAGAFLALRRRRAAMTTSALWSRRGTVGPPDPDDPNPPPEPGTRLRDEADPDTASWLAAALRSWNGSPGMPAPARVFVGAAGVAVAFDDVPDAGLPDGWAASGDKVVTLERDMALRGTGLSPLPGLVSVGRRDDGTVLMLDLESLPGVVAIDGVDDVARGAALSMAVDTATHPWADDRTVTLVGFADDFSSIGNVRRTDDLGRVFESLENVARFQRTACREAGVADVREARAAYADADAWSYQLVVCSGVPSPDELGRLDALAADPMVSLGVVVIGAAREASVRLTARDGGRLTSPMLGVDVLAQVLGVAAARDLAALFEPPPHVPRVSIDQLVDAMQAEQPVATAADAVAAVSVLGTVEVEATGDIDPERQELLTELACFLALHPTGVHTNRISAALWPRGVADDIRDAALQQLATWLGVTADGHPVLVQESGVWRLAPGAVRLDWDVFRDSLNASADDGGSRERHLRAALDLVRGPAFDDLPVGRYAWLEALTTEGDIAMAVGLTAQALAEAAAARDDEPAARAALARGLALAPASEELWRSKLRLTAHFGERSDLEAVADEMYAAIAAHGSPVGASAQTDSLVDDVLPGYRSRVA